MEKIIAMLRNQLQSGLLTQSVAQLNPLLGGQRLILNDNIWKKFPVQNFN